MFSQEFFLKRFFSFTAFFQRYFLWPLLFLLVLFLRFFRLSQESLWSDEAYTAVFVRDHTLFEIFSGQARDRVNPPLYYGALRVWTIVFGQSEFALRFLSVLFGVLTVLGVYFLLRLCTRRFFLQWFGVFLAAIFWPLVTYAQEARAYALLVLWSVFSVIFFLRLLKKFSWLGWLGFVILNIAGIYTHYAFWVVLGVEIFVCFTLPIGKKFLEREKFSARWFPILLGCLLSGVSFLFWFFRSTWPDLIHNSQSPFWQPPLRLRDVTHFFGNACWLDRFPSNLVITLLLVFFIFSVWVFRTASFRQRFLLFFLFSFVAAPFVVFGIFGIWIDRYALVALPFLYVFVALLFEHFQARWVVCIVFLIFFISMPWYQDYFRDIQKEPWRLAVSYIDSFDDGTGKIFVNKEFSKFPWKYYYHGGSSASFPQGVGEREEKNYRGKMKKFPYVVIVYMQPTDTKHLLVRFARDVFSQEQHWQHGSIEVYYFFNE